VYYSIIKISIWVVIRRCISNAAPIFRRATFWSLRSLILVCCAAFCFLNLFSLNILWNRFNPKARDYLLSMPELRESTGPMTGRTGDLYAGHIATLLKREMWNSIDPNRNESAAIISTRLKLWGTTQILWNGKLYAPLDELKTFTRAGPFLIGGEEFYIYSNNLPS